MRFFEKLVVAYFFLATLYIAYQLLPREICTKMVQIAPKDRRV